MKILKIAIITFLVGQTLSLFYKDESFKKKLKATDWTSKLKLIIDELIDLNQRIFFDVKDFDYNKAYDAVNAEFDIQKTKVEKKINDLAKKADSLNKEQIAPLIAEAEDQYNKLMDGVKEAIKNIEDRYKNDEKITKVKKQIDDLKKKSA